MRGFVGHRQDFQLLFYETRSSEGFQWRSDGVWHVKKTMVAFELKGNFGHFWMETEKSIGNYHNNPGGEMMVVKSVWQQWT